MKTAGYFLFLILIIMIAFPVHAVFPQTAFQDSLKSRIDFFLQLKNKIHQVIEELEKFQNTRAGKRIMADRYERVFYNYLTKIFQNTSNYVDWLIETAIVEDMLGKREQNIIFNKKRVKIFREDILGSVLYGLSLVADNTSNREFKNLCLKIKTTIQELNEQLQNYTK